MTVTVLEAGLHPGPFFAPSTGPWYVRVLLLASEHGSAAVGRYAPICGEVVPRSLVGKPAVSAVENTLGQCFVRISPITFSGAHDGLTDRIDIGPAIRSMWKAPNLDLTITGLASGISCSGYLLPPGLDGHEAKRRSARWFVLFPGPGMPSQPLEGQATKRSPTSTSQGGSRHQRRRGDPAGTFPAAVGHGPRRGPGHDR